MSKKVIKELVEVLEELLTGDHLWDCVNYPNDPKSADTIKVIERARAAVNHGKEVLQFKQG